MNRAETFITICAWLGLAVSAGWLVSIYFPGELAASPPCRKEIP